MRNLLHDLDSDTLIFLKRVSKTKSKTEEQVLQELVDKTCAKYDCVNYVLVSESDINSYQPYIDSIEGMDNADYNSRLEREIEKLEKKQLRSLRENALGKNSKGAREKLQEIEDEIVEIRERMA